MKIALDAMKLHIYGLEKGGVYQYVLNLIQGLAKVDRENEYRLFFPWFRACHKASLATALELVPEGNFTAHPLRFPLRVWRTLRFPVEALVGRVDVYHGPVDYLPPSLFAKTVVTIHDLAYLRTPQSLWPELVGWLGMVLPRAAQRADAIITVSEYCKADIVESLGVPEEKVVVTYHGVHERFRRLATEDIDQAILLKYGITRDYLLFVGTLQPNKNLETLIAAYYHLRQAYRLQVALVIAGQKGWHYDGIYRKVQDLGLEQDVVFTGYVVDEDLPTLYNQAQLFVTAACFEGFGIPVIEAMACGVPVVASKAAALQEVVADAGLLAAPLSIPELTEAMARALTDTTLRQDMIARGYVRAQQFTWERTARQTLAVYKQLAGSN